MDRRIAALTFALTLACFSDEPPEVVSDEGGAMPDVPADDGVMAFDACVELMGEMSRLACDGADGGAGAMWCDNMPAVLDGCYALGVVGEERFARADVDACLDDVHAEVCYFANGTVDGNICGTYSSASTEDGWIPGPFCSDACNNLGIFEACVASDICGEALCFYSGDTGTS